MKLLEISNYQSDLPAALAKAKADVPQAEVELKAAEGRLAAAESQRMAIQRRYGEFTSSIPLLRDKYQDAKRRAMVLESEGDGRDTTSGWQAYRRLKNEYQQAVDTFAWFSVFPMEDAAMNFLEAQIEERVATANLLEAQACRARCGVLVATMNAQQYDPGISLDSGESWSNQQSKRAAEIMTREIPILREQLTAAKAQVEQNRAAMSNSIWS